MTIQSTHSKDPAIAWDVTLTVNGEKAEEIISRVAVQINGSTLFDDELDPPSNTWKKEFLQKGIYPGLNKLVVTAQNQDGKSKTYTEEWGS